MSSSLLPSISLSSSYNHTVPSSVEADADKRDLSVAHPTVALQSSLLTTPVGDRSSTFHRPSTSKPYAPSASSGRSHRPLSLSRAPNLPDIMYGTIHNAPLDGPGDIPSGRQLKRLSLLSRPLHLPTSPSSATPRLSPHSLHEGLEPLEGSAGEDEPDTPRAGTTTPRGRERAKGIRSSISYASSPTASLRSPGPVETRGAGRTDREGEGGSWRPAAGLGLGVLREAEGGHDVASGAPGVESGSGGVEERRTEKELKAKGITLTEKHADLLTLIAQKERKVNELRLELAQQEAALNFLKQKWTTIATRTARPFTTQSSVSSSSSVPTAGPSSSRSSAPVQQRRSQIRPRPVTHASASSISSTSSNPTLPPTSPTSPSDTYSPLHLLADEEEAAALIGPSAQAVLNNLLATAYGPEGVVTPSAVEGGRKFWGQLVKTVSAAAAGTVPGSDLGPDVNHEADASKTLDISALKNIVSLPTWSSLIPTPSSSTHTRPIRQPANHQRLPRQREQSATSTASANTQSPELQTPHIDQDSAGGAQTSLRVGGWAQGSGERSGIGSMASSFQDLMDFQDEPEGMEGTIAPDTVRPGTVGGAVNGDKPDCTTGGNESEEDEWGW